MSQHDMNIANQGFPAFRSDLNDALAALVSTSSGATAPTTTFANQLWYDTTADRLKIRNEANSAWIEIVSINQTTGVLTTISGTVIATPTITGAATFAAGTAAAPALTTTGDTNTGIFFPAADTIAFAEGGAEVMRIDSSGNLTLTSTGQRLRGDLSNTTIASRLMFQTSTTDGSTNIECIPNGTNTTANIIASNNSSDPANTSAAALTVTNTEVRVQSFVRGTGTVLPLTFHVNSTERFRVGTSGQLGIGGANYGTSGQVLTSNGAAAAPSWSTVSGGTINVQSFDASGTWTKPAGYSASSRVLVQAWGGGGSGSRNTNQAQASGGGGGGYNQRWLNLSQLGATETITIGGGGLSRTTTNQNGDQGGNTTVGSLITAYGGAGGQQAGGGGGGGGPLSAGVGVEPGYPYFTTDGGSGTSQNRQGTGAQVGSGQENGAFVHGAGGASGTGFTAQNSVWGGGGGGCANTGNQTAGTSVNGGNGGAGGATGAAGSQPAGGGGGGTTTSGAGGAGRVIITVFPA